MGVPSWVARGAPCICIDDNWTDIDTGLPTDRLLAAPKKGARYTVSDCHDLAQGFLILAEFSHRPDLWGADAFRPLTAEERDSEMFDKILKGASVEKRRELEPVR